VLQTVQEKGLARSKLQVLAALTRLRQICCHPALVGSDCASGKTETFFELIEPLFEEGQKVLVFSQFVRMLLLLEGECRKRQIPTYLLTGETKDRQEVVQAFTDDPNPGLFLLSLRAAGTGLNLTTASYVVLYDPWWNPAVEDQAINRVHRIGQQQPVTVTRFHTVGTIEQRIANILEGKRKVFNDLLSGAEKPPALGLSEEEIFGLFDIKARPRR
jgi:SNF2 family DNA or RNA helicase